MKIHLVPRFIQLLSPSSSDRRPNQKHSGRSPWGLYISRRGTAYFQSPNSQFWNFCIVWMLLHMDQKKDKEHDAENRMPKFILEPLFWNIEN